MLLEVEGCGRGRFRLLMVIEEMVIEIEEMEMEEMEIEEMVIELIWLGCGPRC